MALTVKLQQRQGQIQGLNQGLTMTPQLVQSIKLLQMNSFELLEHIGQEIEKNPLLELAEPGDNYNRETEMSETETATLDVSSELDTSTAALEEKLGTSLENEFDSDRSGGEISSKSERPSTDDIFPFPMNTGAMPSGPNYSGMSGATGFQDGEYNIENFLATKPTLREHLGAQLAITRVEDVIRLIAADIIDSLDEDGYLRRDAEEVAQTLGVKISEVSAALALVQGMEPTGVGARNLAENIKLQLIEKNRFDPAMQCLIDNLELLAKRDFNGLAKLCNLGLDDIMDMVEEVRGLDPRPARRFDHFPIQEIIPDVFVRELPDGSFGIELNPDALPKVLINQTYQAIVTKSASSDKDKTFIAECLQNANWLTRSLEQRAQTILKVTAEIVRQQDGFFINGIRHLRPMSLKRIADEIKMHESTVSRVTSNKYLQSSRGMFELKFFFTAAISGVDGATEFSAESVRHEIRQLIDTETVETILSDDSIVGILQGKGIEIARRTVAKYREALHIPSSVQRRREKKANLKRP